MAGLCLIDGRVSGNQMVNELGSCFGNGGGGFRDEVEHDVFFLSMF